MTNISSTLSTSTVLINTVSDSDETITTAMRLIPISEVIGITAVPVSNTKSKIIVLYVPDTV